MNQENGNSGGIKQLSCDEQLNLWPQLGAKFETRDDVINVVKDFYSKQGYCLSIKFSRKDKYVCISFYRGGEYRDKRNIPIEERQRKASTHLTSCSCRIYGKRHEDGYWALLLKDDNYNHEASKGICGRPCERVFLDEEIVIVDKMNRAGIPPFQIL